MGDVLTGLIAALLAQGATRRTMPLAAVYLHGAAADALVAKVADRSGWLPAN